MFFGLCNSPATFQSMMDHIFVIQVGEGWIIIYMDNILICDVTLKGIKDKTRKVLKILKENNLYLKPEKCVFEATRIEYLGYVIEEGKIMMDPVKVKGIVDWPAPTTLRQLRSFLGFCNYYRKFIKKYSDKSQALNELLQKEDPGDGPTNDTEHSKH